LHDELSGIFLREGLDRFLVICPSGQLVAGGMPFSVFESFSVMAGLVPAIHVFLGKIQQSRGCPGHLREDALRAFARA
jgi:hypothetical protein